MRKSSVHQGSHVVSVEFNWKKISLLEGKLSGLALGPQLYLLWKQQTHAPGDRFCTHAWHI